MKTENFIANMADALEIDAAELNNDTVFKDLASWDSLAALSMIAMIDDSYNVSVGGDDLEKAITVQNLRDLLEARMS
jgi:acyl carrier protein